MNLSEITLSRKLWQKMKDQVSAEAPLEACGLIAGRGGNAEAVYPITNMLKSPVKFRMEPKEQLQALEEIEAAGLELLAIYHSHPSGPESPSATDLKEAHYPVAYLIWAIHNNEWQVRAYRLDNNSAAEMGLCISEM